MTHEIDAMRARAYLLGNAGERDGDVIEQEYFRSAEALAMVEAAEEALIEDYLARRLTEEERTRFERHYLAAPGHRTRVETIRRLTQRGGSRRAAAPAAAARGMFNVRMLAAAAALVLVAGAGIWIARQSGHPDRAGAAPAGGSPATPSAGSTGQPAPIAAFAWSLSPVTVRGAADTPALVVPSGTDVVDLRFEGEGTASPIARGRVTIRTVAGDDVWQGPIAPPSNQPAGVVAAAQVPAARLRPDDYTITLFETGASGAESERYRYFLRVRVR